MTAIIQGQLIHALLFADDLVLVSKSVEGLQRLLNRLEEWCDCWCMEVNIAKTKVVVFKKNTKLAVNERWYYKGALVEVVPEFKYLGLCLSYNGKWNKHITRAITSAKMMVVQLSKLAFKCPYLPSSLLLKIHDATLKPAILYGAEIWGLETYAAPVDGPSTTFLKKLLRLPPSASNAGTNLYFSRAGIKIDINAEAVLRSINYWLKIVQMPEHRLVKKCFAFQLQEIQQGRMCWGLKLKTQLHALGFGQFWPGGPDNVRQFRREIENRLGTIARVELLARCAKYVSLIPLRVVKSLVGADSPICEPTIESNVDKRRWCVMTLLSCPGSLIKCVMNRKLCSGCSEEVDNIFVHIMTTCSKIPGKLREDIGIQSLISKINSDPDSALQTLTHALFLSESRFCLQLKYVKFFKYVRG